VNRYFCFRCPFCEKVIQQRSERQNVQLHTLAARLAKFQDWPRGSGEKRSTKFWVRLLVVSWQRALGREAAAVPAIDGVGEDGSGIDFIHTSKFPISEMDDFLAYADKWAEQHGCPA
jgi:hypothetical protein